MERLLQNSVLECCVTFDPLTFHRAALLPLQVPSLAKAAAISRIALCSR